MIASFRNRTRFTVLFFALAGAVSVAALTDAKAGERRHFVKALDPAAVATIEKLQQPLSFELSGASLGDLINAVSNKTGVVIAQSAEAATSPVQTARFTVKAENVPAHTILMEALMPFELDAVPTPEGVTISKGDGRHTFRVLRHRGATAGEDIIVTNGSKPEALRVMKVLEGEAAPGEASEHVFIHKIEKGDAAETSDGAVRRELTIKTERNGEKSEGKLTIEIAR